jgi:uncharacterized damage-inducible protein DinB
MANKSIQDELKDYVAMFVALKEIVDETSNDILMTRPESDKWSIKELVCHIVDTEHNFTLRMKKIIAEDNPMLMKYDQDKWAEQLNYMEWDMKETILLFGLLRNSMAGILQNLPAAAWKRKGNHEETGTLTLRNLLEDANHHCKHHLAQIVANKMKLEKS